MKTFKRVACVVAALAVSMLGGELAKAGTDDIIAEVGKSMVFSQDGEVNSNKQWRVALGYGNVYAWGASEDVQFSILGQTHTWGNMTAYGLGAQFEIVQDFYVFGEFGRATFDTQQLYSTVEEVTYTRLVNNHENEGRPIPFATCHQGVDCNRSSEATVDDAWVGRVGVKYQPLPFVYVSASYRAITVPSYIGTWDIDRKANLEGWWEEQYGVDAGGFEIGAGFKW